MLFMAHIAAEIAPLFRIKKLHLHLSDGAFPHSQDLRPCPEIRCNVANVDVAPQQTGLASVSRKRERIVLL
jgi:hypothetical protein